MCIFPVLLNDEKWHYSTETRAATKRSKFCEFWFQMACFSLNAVLCVLGIYVYICLAQKNLKISLELYIRLEYRKNKYETQFYVSPCVKLLFFSLTSLNICGKKLQVKVDI